MTRASLRAEQDELRARMRAVGMSHDEIAVEFARRYHYRPRAAHRHARGWTQTQAANHINAHAAQAGLDPDGAAPMTGPKLSEVENWPLPNNRRRPTPQLLALLAEVYDTAIHNLIDLDDREQLTPADMLLLSRIDRAGPGEHRDRSLPVTPHNTRAPQQPSTLAARAETPAHLGMPWPAVEARPPAVGGGMATPMPSVAADLAGASRSSDPAGYLRDQIGACAGADGAQGPAAALPTMLGTVSAIEDALRRAPLGHRRELLGLGARAAEFVGWLYRDAGLLPAAAYWQDRAEQWAQEAGDLPLQGYILLKKSQLAWDERDGARMLTLAQAVQDGPWTLPASVRSEAAQQEARGHALTTRDLAAVERKLSEARDLLAASVREHDEQDMSPHYSPALLMLQSALCYAAAGQLDRALTIFQRELRPAVFSLRDYGYFRALMAGVLADLGEPDEAASVGTQALNIGRITGSMRTWTEISRTMHTLTPWAARPSVRDLKDAVVTAALPPAASHRPSPPLFG
jgi:tetratricopeptide (TPR) repeat protein/transcriptional regulator with XRE-family HTH domain